MKLTVFRRKIHTSERKVFGKWTLFSKFESEELIHIFFLLVD